MVPSVRWESVLGVDKFDKVPPYVGVQKNFNKVEIYLRQHIGAPSVCLVNDGDEVKKGDKIAESGEGLSLPQYASIDGKVLVEDRVKIIIEKVDE